MTFISNKAVTFFFGRNIMKMDKLKRTEITKPVNETVFGNIGLKMVR